MKRYLLAAGLVCGLAAPALADEVGVRVGRVQHDCRSSSLS
jgi:hypothetical protein